MKKENKKKIRKREIFLILLLVFFIIIFLILFLKTGFLQLQKIDVKDLNHWDYDEQGIIIGAEKFNLDGNKDICWFLVHGYGSTPKDMKELAFNLNNEFGEYIMVPRLKGHGTKPSDLLYLNFNDWYGQVENEFNSLSEKCEKINVVGFSLGAALILKLVQEKQDTEINNIYLISPFLKIRYKFWHVIPKENIINLFADFVFYSKKITPAQINYKQGLNEYIGYLNFPLIPLKNSFEEINQVIEKLYKIKNNILIQHSKNDDTIDIKSAYLTYENVKSINKELIIFNKSNHVLLFDYDKQKVINNIVEFEKKTRK